MSVKRIAVGVSDWPECLGERFDITTARDGETDIELIARAAKSYSPGLVIEIESRLAQSDAEVQHG